MSRERAEADMARVQADIRRLEAQLHDARQRSVKIAHYLEMSRYYEGDGETGGVQPARTTGGNSGLAVRTVINLLREGGRPVHTRDLIEELRKRGILVGGSNPVTNLSGYLSRAEELVSDRTHGWRLKEWAQDGEAAEPRSQEGVAPSHARDDATERLMDQQPTQPIPSWDAPAGANGDLDEEIPF